MSDEDFHRSCPIPLPGLCLMARYEMSDAHAPLAEWWATYGNRQIDLTTREREVLMRSGGGRTIHDIARDIPGETPRSVGTSVLALRDRGLLSIAQAESPALSLPEPSIG